MAWIIIQTQKNSDAAFEGGVAVSAKASEPERFHDQASAQAYIEKHPEFTGFEVVDECSQGDANP